MGIVLITRLPNPDFAKSAELLDDPALGAQCADGLEVLKALAAGTNIDHETIIRWKGYGIALLAYTLRMCEEWERRGYDAKEIREEALTCVHEVTGMSVEGLEGAAHQDILAQNEQVPPWLKEIAQEFTSTSTTSQTTQGENEVSDNGNMARPALVDALRAKGYDGPVSYTKPRLLDMLATLESGGTIEKPKRGRKGPRESSTEESPKA